MELLFFGGRHRYPGETVSWSELLGEWMAHPILTGAMLLCVIWMFIRIYAAWKNQKQEKEEQERQRELWGDTFAPAEQEKQSKPSYEDTYLDIPPSHRVPDGEVPFGERNKTTPKYEWKLFPILLTLGFVIGMGGSVGGISDVLMLLMVAVLLGILIVAKHLPANWVYTSFEEDREEKKAINWKGVGKDLLPYGAAFVIGILFGLLQQWLIRG